MKSSKHDLEGLILFSVGELHKEMFNRANKTFSKEGYPVQAEQMPVLMCCFYEGEISQQEIADLTQRDKSSIQRTVTYLVNRNLVEVVQDMTDKRRNIVRLTDDGKKLGKKIEDGAFEMENALFTDKLTEKEKETFIALAKKIKKIISEF